MKLKLLDTLNKAADEELQLREDFAELADVLYGGRSPSSEQILEIWNDAPDSKRVSEAQAAMDRAGEMEWLRTMQADAETRQGTLPRKGLGMPQAGTPKVGDAVVLGRGVSGKIVDQDPPSGTPTAVMVQTRMGEKVIQVGQLSPKIIRGPDGRTRTAWILGAQRSQMR